jgi:hypothetical protein
VFDLRRRGSRPANAGAEAPDNPSGLSASQPVVLSPTNAIISLCLTTLTLPWIIEVTAIGPSLGSEIGAWAKAGSQNNRQTPAATTKWFAA